MNKMTRHSKIGSRAWLLAAALAGITAAAAAAPSMAAGGDVPQVVVKYGDLNLKSEQGVRTLYRRLNAAARAVCPSPSSRELTHFHLAETCRAEAVARAIHELNVRYLANLPKPLATTG